jgi:hypothetical protein
VSWWGLNEGEGNTMARRTKTKQISIEGPSSKDRPVRVGFYLTEVNAHNLKTIARMSSLNGKQWDGSDIANEALELWFEKQGFPTDRFLSITVK